MYTSIVTICEFVVIFMYLTRNCTVYVNKIYVLFCSMDGVHSMAFEYSYEKSSLICFIYQSLSKYRKIALKFVFRFLLFSLTGVTLCN